MSSCTSYNRIKSVLKLHDKFIASAFLCHLDDLFICSLRISLSNIFTYRFIEQIIILCNICNFPIKICKRHFFDINSTDFNTSGIHIPQGRNQLCDGRLAASGRSYDCIYRSCFQLHSYSVQDLFVVITKSDIFKSNGVIFWNTFTFLWTFKLRLFQNSCHFTNNHSDLAKIICIGTHCDQRSNDSK